MSQKTIIQPMDENVKKDFLYQPPQDLSKILYTTFETRTKKKINVAQLLLDSIHIAVQGYIPKNIARMIINQGGLYNKTEIDNVIECTIGCTRIRMLHFIDKTPSNLVMYVYKGNTWVPHGKQLRWHPDGSIHQSHSYKNGSKHGIHVGWYKNGAIKYNMKYYNDRIQVCSFKVWRNVIIGV